MLGATLPDGSLVTVRLSFWECVKAGMAFTVGALVASAIAGIVYLLVAGSVLLALMRALVAR